MSHINTAPTEVEQAVVALLKTRGAKVPIEVVDARKAFLAPPSEPVIRVSQIDSWVTSPLGGSHGRFGHLLAGNVKIALYDADLPDLVGIREGAGRPIVAERHRRLTDAIDVYEIESKSGPSGQVGAMRAGSVILTLGILPAAPPIHGGDHGLGVKKFTDTIKHEVQWRVPSSRPYAGELSIWAEVRAEVIDAGTPDDDGVVTRKLALEVETGPVRQRGSNLADARRRALHLIDGLKLRALPSVGRIVAVEIGEPITDGETYQITIPAELDVRGWHVPKGVTRR